MDADLLCPTSVSGVILPMSMLVEQRRTRVT